MIGESIQCDVNGMIRRQMFYERGFLADQPDARAVDAVSQEFCSKPITCPFVCQALRLEEHYRSRHLPKDGCPHANHVWRELGQIVEAAEGWRHALGAC